MNVRKAGVALLFCSALALVFPSGRVAADPCGMVPPIYTGPGSPIARTGLQQTYVFFDQGVESFVIRPAFSGKVDNFGMLIPFPTPPAIRKVADNVFDQIKNAIDPPEVVVDLRPRVQFGAGRGGGGGGAGGVDYFAGMEAKDEDRLEVLNEEAVGMYEVAVLSAGSAKALKKWMDQNKYQYPRGMDEVTDEGELRNIVYLLTRGAKKIRSIPEEYVVRQLSGNELVKNLTAPVPLRIIGGTLRNIAQERQPDIDRRRQPGQYNGVAKTLFASDIRAVELFGESQDELTLAHETTEKELLRIGEHFGLRGSEINVQISSVIDKEAIDFADSTLRKMRKMTLTVVDGDFPREVVANQNLSFGRFEMSATRNSAKFYDAKLHGPAAQKQGNLYSSANPWKQINERHVSTPVFAAFGMLGLVLLAGPAARSFRNQTFYK